jgi:hypothetical protein
MADRQRWARDKAWHAARSRDVDVMLDIREIETNELEVIGLSPQKVLFDPERHVALERSRFRGLDWDNMPFGRRGFLGTRLRRLVVFDDQYGVFLRPNRNGARELEQELSAAYRQLDTRGT